MKTLNKYFVFSDVHGEYDALQTALKDAGYDRNNPTHKLISLGDNFDRGPKSKDIFQFLKNRNAICVKGNHDLFLQEYLEKGMDGEFVLFNILHNGLGETIKSFGNTREDNIINVKELERTRVNILNYFSGLASWIKNMPLCYETEHCIFTHAGINPTIPNWKDTDEHYMTWDIEDSYAQCNNTYKIVFIGHHHAFRVKQQAEEHGVRYVDINKDKPELFFPEDGTSHRILSFGNTDEHSPYLNGNKIAIDGCSNLTKKVNVVVIEDYPLEEEKEQKEEEIKISTKINNGISYGTYNPVFTTTADIDVNWMPF